MFSNFFLRWPRLRISSVSYLRLISIPFPSHLYFSSTDKTSLWQEAQYVAIHYCHSHYLHWWVSCDPAVQTLSTLHHYFFIFIFSLKVIWLLTPTTDCHFFFLRGWIKAMTANTMWTGDLNSLLLLLSLQPRLHCSFSHWTSHKEMCCKQQVLLNRTRSSVTGTGGFFSFFYPIIKICLWHICSGGVAWYKAYFSMQQFIYLFFIFKCHRVMWIEQHYLSLPVRDWYQMNEVVPVRWSSTAGWVSAPQTCQEAGCLFQVNPAS